LSAVYQETGEIKVVGGRLAEGLFCYGAVFLIVLCWTRISCDSSYRISLGLRLFFRTRST